MNICSNCGKEVSMGAAHCGHCGHRQEVTQKRTMIGMGAVDPEWQQKLMAARAAAEEKEQAAEDMAGALDQTAAMEPVSAAAIGGFSEDDDELGTAPTQMMEPLDPKEIARFADEAPAPAIESGGTDLADTIPQEPFQLDQQSATAPLAAASASGEEAVGPSWQIGELSAPTSPEPMNFQGALAGGAEPAAAMVADMEATEAAGGGKGRMILIVAILGVLLSCCAVSVLSYFLLGDTIQEFFESAEDTEESP